MDSGEVKSNKGVVLVVDDTRDNVRFLADILRGEGYSVRPALSGVLALVAVEKDPPDIILLDVMMPEMNGYQVCGRLKADEKTRDIPVIFISALDEVADKVKGFKVGGVDFITKPFQVEEVLARIDTHLTLRRLQVEREQKNKDLEAALAEIKALRGLIPICSKCKKVRDDEGYWKQIEFYIQEHSEATFSHSLCPDCIKILYPEFAGKVLARLTKD